MFKIVTDLSVVADGGAIDWSVPGTIDVPVSIRDIEGAEVFSAMITMSVSDKKEKTH